MPDEGTRPTSDRVREAVFNMVEARADLAGSHVLDLYAGSGALGLEALSRGARGAVLVDSARRAVNAIAANIRTCDVADQASVVSRPVATYLAGTPSSTFDVVFLDPPYDIDNAAVTSALASLTDGAWLAPESIVIVERGIRSPDTVWPDGLAVQVEKRYGDTRVEVAARGR